MKKAILIILSFTILITALIGPIYSNPVSAANELQQRVGETAKIALGLYLISRVSRMVSEVYFEEDDSPKASSIIQQDKVNNQEMQNNHDLRDNEIISNSRLSLQNKVIVIDPGHGGYDPGAVGTNGLKEKDVALDTALKLRKILENNTLADIYLTRETDRFITLQERTNFAFRKNADIFISIHHNADENRSGSGIETYAHYSTSEKTWALSWYLHDSLVNNLRFPDRGLKADNFHVIRETSSLKAVLLEIGFISDINEERALSQEETRIQAANAIYEGIMNYFQNSSD